MFLGTTSPLVRGETLIWHESITALECGDCTIRLENRGANPSTSYEEAQKLYRSVIRAAAACRFPSKSIAPRIELIVSRNRSSGPNTR